MQEFNKLALLANVSDNVKSIQNTTSREKSIMLSSVFQRQKGKKKEITLNIKIYYFRVNSSLYNAAIYPL